MLRLRPYNKNDAEIIMSWIKDESAFYKCTSCPTCNQTCKDFEKERCCRLDKAPYVCNGCPMKINHCTIAGRSISLVHKTRM